MFTLGNFSISEILMGTIQNFDDELVAYLDQLSSASIEISSDPTEITDKNGNVIRTIYKSKTGTFTATSALLSPVVLNAGSGSDIVLASAEKPVQMPKMVTVDAGATLDVSDAEEGTIRVMGLFANGANGAALSAEEVAEIVADGTLTAPAKESGKPIQYLVKYQRKETEGMMLANRADKFPNTTRVTLKVAVVDPCEDGMIPAYVYIPSFQADPSMTVSLDSETQEVDFSGNLQVNYCGGSKDLYYIYFPGTETLVTGSVA